MNNRTVRTLVIAIIAMVLGIGGTLFVQKQSEPEPVALNDEFFDTMFDDRFFTRSRDPFQEMERLRNQITEHFDRNGARFESEFDDWFKDEFGDYPAASIEMNEDEGHIYYEMDVGSADFTDVQVEAENGMLEIHATTRTSPDSNTTSMSEITQRFPLPEDVDPASVDVTRHDGVIKISLARKGIES
ncbi:MAG: Hsp20/alpha crystallin family protein [Pseudomonadales bacterium]|nr:Hsp20/alpha crystallin family protein [Pseudomonadales bacterium]